MRKILSVLTAIVILISLVACGNSEEQEGKTDVLVADILEKMKEKINEDAGGFLFDEGMLRGYIEGSFLNKDDESPYISMFLEKSKIDSSKLAEGLFLVPMESISSDQIILLKAKSAEDITALRENLERELEEQHRTWEGYLSDQYEKVRNNVMITEGLYLAYITTGDPESFEEIFKENVK